MTAVARTLYDITQGFDWPLDSEARVRRALRLLRRIVPYDRCGLLDAAAAGAPRLVVEPDAAEEREGVSRILTRFLTLLTNEAHRGTDPRPSDAALVPLWASASHLAVPILGLDRVLGVLFVRGTDVYTNDHLRLLGVVAAQIAGYLTACRLHEAEAQRGVDHAVARAAADASSHAKDEFVAILGREVRTLLAPMRASMQSIGRQAEQDPAVRRAVDVVERQMASATRLVDDLRDASSAGRGNVALHKERVTLQRVVTTALATTRDAIAARGHRLSVSLPETPLWIDADVARLAHAIGSVLDNAAKFTPAGGAISVSADHDGTGVVLRVRDTGVGVSPEILPFLFDLCARAQRSLPYADTGIGVGLTLARVLIELHGGSVTARSDGAGRGSEFAVRLPGG